jgi:subtilisin family serine protease
MAALLVADGEWAAKEAQDAHNSLGSPPSGPTIDSMRYRAIYKLWPDFPVQSQIYRSVATVKADAAFKSFGAAGAGIVWAVIDSGIDENHQHFDIASGHALRSSEVRDLHRCFVDSESTFAGIPVLAPAPMNPDGLERPSASASQRRLALTDDFGHGTHVAGIIAGTGKPGTTIRLLERVEEVTPKDELERGQFKQTGTLPAEQVRGMAPNCRLISLRVLDGNGEGRSSDVIRALDYVRERLNDNPKLLRVHGVNLSVGYEFDPEMFACGQSPICAEVNRLVQSRVVVVAAAGNTGFGTVAASVRPTKVGLSNTINDPGNAELAITVGATHRDAPYTYGVSYFSSKGPNGDGRVKPDLVAPGERITSCGAGKRLRKNSHELGTGARGLPAF